VIFLFQINKIKEAEKTENSLEVAEAYFNIAILQLKLNKFGIAIQSLQKASTILTTLNKANDNVLSLKIGIWQTAARTLLYKDDSVGYDPEPLL